MKNAFALKNAPVVVVCSQDLQLRYNWVNSAVREWQGLDYMGRTAAEIFGEEATHLTEIKEAALRKGVGSHTEITVTLDGVKRYFDLVVEPLRDSRRTLLGLLSSVIDITSMKEKLARLQEALKEVQLLSGLLPIAPPARRLRMSTRCGNPWKVISPPTPRRNSVTDCARTHANTLSRILHVMSLGIGGTFWAN